MLAGIAVADTSSGLYAAIGILIALSERDRSGQGQWIKTSLMQAQIAMMDFQAARYLIEHEVPEQAGNDHPSRPQWESSAPPTATSTSASAVRDNGRAFCAAIGHAELADQPDYRTGELRYRNRPKLNAEIARIFARQDIQSVARSPGSR